MKLTADNEAINYLKDFFNKDFIEITVDGEKKIFVSEEKLKEKDKIIDLMAEWIEKHTKYYDEDGCYCEVEKDICNKNIECEYCIKQYCERKVENEN